MEPGDRRRIARRRAVRIARVLQSWPLWRLGAIPVGLAVRLAGYATGRLGWFRLGEWITMPSVGLLGSLILVLTLSGVLNLGLFARNTARRSVDCGSGRP